MKAQFLKNWQHKTAVATALMTTAMVASANSGIEGISSTITAEIAKVVPVISAVGMALLSVAVLVKAFRLVSGFLGSGR